MPDLFDEYGIDPNQQPAQPEQANTKDLFDRFAIETPKAPVQAERPTPSPVIPKVADLPEPDQQYVQGEVDKSLELARTMYSEDEIEAIKAKGKIGFFEASKFLDYEDVLPGGGLFQGVEALQLINATKKIENGEETSVGEDELVRKFVRETIEKDIRGFSVPGGIAYGGSQLPAFLVEFVATAGAGKAAQEGVEAIAKAGIKEGVKAGAIRSATAKTAGLTANVAARTALMPAQYAAQYGEQRLNNFVGVTDKGSVVFKEGDESPAMSAFKAVGYTGIETASELAGGGLNKLAAPVVSKYLKTPILEGVAKLPAHLRLNLYKAHKVVAPNSAVSKVFTATGWNGMLSEIGEERLADVMRATFDMSLDDEFGFDDYMDAITPSKDQLLIESGIIAMTGGVRGSANAVVNILQSRGMNEAEAKEVADNMSATEQENLVAEETAPKAAEDQLELPIDEVASQDPVRSEPPAIDNSESVFQEAYRVLVNDIQPLENLEKKSSDLTEIQKPSTLARAYRGVMSTISYNLKHGTTRFNPETGTNEVTGKSYQAILDDFDAVFAPIEGNKKQRKTDFDDYRIAMSILDDVEISKTDENVSIPQSQIDLAHTNLQRLQEKYGEEYQFLEEFGKESTEYSQRVLLNLVDSGVLSQDKYDELIAKRPNFTSLQRVMEDSDVQSVLNNSPLFSDIEAKNVLKFRKGSERDIKDVNETIIRNTAVVMDAAARNRVGVALVDMADAFPENIQQVKSAGKGTITVKEEGAEKHYKVSKPLLEAMEGLNPTQMNLAQKLLDGTFRLPASLLRFGATIVPEFAIRNFLRDNQTAFINSGGRSNPIDTIKGLAYQIGGAQMYKDWMKDGGSFNSYMDLNDKGIQKAYKELLREDGNLMKYANPIRILETINMSLEQAPRIGAYAKLRKQGLGGTEAALYSRDLTVDFSRGGAFTRSANRYIPFLNAGVQGLDKAVRVFKDNPEAATAWAVATVTVPSVSLAAFYLYGADEETRQEWLEIPQWQKDLFWLAKIDGQWKRYPKPFNFGYIFGSLPERFMIWGYEGDKPEMKKFGTETLNGIIGSAMPIYDASSVIPTLPKVLIENTTNHNFFTGRPIYPEWMERSRTPEKRANKYTSETAKLLGEQLGVSPAIIDNTIRGYLAGAGNYVTDAGDGIINEVRKWNGQEVPERPKAPSDTPVIKAFSVREPVGTQANSVANFYEDWNDITQIHATYNSLVDDEKEAFLEQNEDKIRLYKPVRKLYFKRLSRLNKEADSVYQDLDMTSEEKVEALSEIGKEILEIAKEANEYIKDNKE